MRSIDHPIYEYIQLPKLPKRRKIVIKQTHIRNLLKEIEKLKVEYKLKVKSAILISATSGIRAEELYKLTLEEIDVKRRTIYIKAENTKDYEDRVTFFNLEAQEALIEYLNLNPKILFPKKSTNYHLKKINSPLIMKHMRKFFSQQSDSLGMPTSIKKILMSTL